MMETKTEKEKQIATDYRETTEKKLADNVHQVMNAYFEDLDGQHANKLYALFLEEVEKPFFEVVMKYTKGNVTRAAQILGLNRATLRSRLKKYGLN